MRHTFGRFAQFALCILQVSICAVAANAADAVLVRGWFILPPDRMAEFRQVYGERIAPLLAESGFKEADAPARATEDSVFARLYAFRSVGAYLKSREALMRDPDLDSLLVSLGGRFGHDETSDRIRSGLRVYRAEAALDSVVAGAKGRSTASGPGTGFWRSYDVTDGLSGPMVNVILQTENGHLWFGTQNNGISRFDGEDWTHYGKADGLPDDRVRAGLCDAGGRLWFGTLGGLCVYDNGIWRRFDEAGHPLSGKAWPLLEDRSGDLWFGSFEGVIRWDGQHATRYRRSDGLAADLVRSAIQDRSGRYWFATDHGASCFDPPASADAGPGLWTTYTEEAGLPDSRVRGFVQDEHGRIWTATQNGLAVYDGTRWKAFSTQDGLPGNNVTSGLVDRQGRLWVGVHGGAAVFDGSRFRAFTTDNGLVNNEVVSILQDREGQLWFGTFGGLTQYDDRTWRTFREQDGLAHNEVWSSFRDSLGNLWFATGGGFGAGGGGVSRFDGSTWTTYGTSDGLASDTVFDICESPEGDVWVGTSRGVSRLSFSNDGTVTVGSLYAAQGLPSEVVTAVAADEGGRVWIGCYGGGLAAYDGTTLEVYDEADSMPGTAVSDLYVDPGEGTGRNLWIAGYGTGLARFDGRRFVTYGTRDGLPSDEVIAVYRDRSAQLWLATHGGLCRFDGQAMTTIGSHNGLVSNDVHTVFQDKSGVLWVGTDGGGISLYDGQVFQVLAEEDGLASNVVMSVVEDRDGHVWVSTNDGVTRFRRPPPTPPEATIVGVVAGAHLTGPQVSFTSSERLVTFEFGGTSLKTRPGMLVYRYRLEGLDPEWRTTRSRRVEYASIPVGYYAFQVSAVDRDLFYSEEPARISVNVTLPYGRLGLAGALGVALIAFVLATGSAVRRRHERDRTQQTLIETQARLVEEMDRELQTAHEMQMGLLPKLPPAVDGFLLAGTCLPANHVGGDYYNFLKVQGGEQRLAVVIADVSGHAMQAATVAMRFNEMLRYELRGRESAVDILSGLDEALREQIPAEMFVTCGLGILDAPARTFNVASAACPDAYHFNWEAESVGPLGLTGYPLGMSLDLHRTLPFRTAEVAMAPGDVVVFASDGVEDAQNSLGAFYESARLCALIRELGRKDVRPEAIRDEIVSDVRRFMGDVSQPDDITVVVVKAIR